MGGCQGCFWCGEIGRIDGMAPCQQVDLFENPIGNECQEHSTEYDWQGAF